MGTHKTTKVHERIIQYVSEMTVDVYIIHSSEVALLYSDKL